MFWSNCWKISFHREAPVLQICRKVFHSTKEPRPLSEHFLRLLTVYQVVEKWGSIQSITVWLLLVTPSELNE